MAKLAPELFDHDEEVPPFDDVLRQLLSAKSAPPKIAPDPEPADD